MRAFDSAQDHDRPVWQASGDLGAATVFGLVVIGWGLVKNLADMPIAKAGQEMFAAQDGSKELARTGINGLKLGDRMASVFLRLAQAVEGSMAALP